MNHEDEKFIPLRTFKNKEEKLRFYMDRVKALFRDSSKKKYGKT